MFLLEDSSYLLLENGDNLLEEYPQTYSFQVETGVFSLTGIDVGLAKQWKLPVETGIFTLSGKDVTFRRTYVIQAETGEFILTGNDVLLKRGLIMRAETGQYILTGNDINFKRFKMIAGAGVFTITGYPVSFLHKNGEWIKEKESELDWEAIEKSEGDIWTDINTVTTHWDQKGDSGFDLLLENGDYILNEEGDKIKLEQEFLWYNISNVSTIWN